MVHGNFFLSQEIYILSFLLCTQGYMILDKLANISVSVF